MCFVARKEGREVERIAVAGRRARPQIRIFEDEAPHDLQNEARGLESSTQRSYMYGIGGKFLGTLSQTPQRATLLLPERIEDLKIYCPRCVICTGQEGFRFLEALTRLCILRIAIPVCVSTATKITEEGAVCLP